MLQQTMDAYSALLAIVMLAVYNKSTKSMNVDSSRPIVFFPAPPSSRFGFSLAFRENGPNKWLMVGAPKANSTYQPSLTESGVLYKCDIIGLTCDQVPLDMDGNEFYKGYKDRKDHQFAASAIDVSPDGDKVVACAPSWAANLYGSEPFYLMNGMCYLAKIVKDSFASSKVKKLFPLLTWSKQTVIREISPGKKVSTAFHALGQTGMATHYAHDGTLVMGSPGVDKWSGAIIHYRGRSNVDVLYGPTESELQHVDAYLGYALTSGCYFQKDDLFFVAGAPRFKGRGQVLLYKPTKNNKMAVEVALEGPVFGSYFGATLCTSDINQDGLEDLLVGAPFEGDMDEGAVHVFLGCDTARFEKSSTLLNGNSAEARFGTSIASAGDLNRDGYPDIIVGAPYEDNHAGAVYVYNGGPVGLQTEFPQRISLAGTNPIVKTFGFSLVGGVDVDGNGYPDVAVGAYASGTAVILLSKPVVDLTVTTVTNPSRIPRPGNSKDHCPEWQQQHAMCIKISVKFYYEGDLSPDSIIVRYTLSVDNLRVLAGIPSRAILNRADTQSSDPAGASTQQTVVIGRGDRAVEDVFYLVFKSVPRDILTPVSLEVSYELVHDDTEQLKPLLTGSKHVHKAVEFDKECGHDERCITDLVPTVGIVVSTGTSYLAFGNPAPLKLHFRMENNGDPAYAAELMIKYPSRIHFVGTSKNAGFDRVKCRGQRSKLEQDAMEIASIAYWRGVLCEVGNPVPANASKEFQVVFDPSEVTDIEYVMFEVSSSTISEDVNKDNDNITLLVPMLYEYNIDARGQSSPDQLYIMDQDSEMLVHRFEIVNMGPGTTSRANIQIDIPISSGHGSLLTVKSIKMQYESVEEQPVVCRHMPKYSQGSIGDLTLDTAESVHLNCNQTKCVTYTCALPTLDIEQHVGIYVSMDVKMTTMAKFENAIELILATEVSIEPSVANVHGNATQSVQALTHLYPQKIQKTVQWWIIGAAIGGGLLIFLVMVLAMYKLGFFRRTKLEEMENPVGQKGDDTSSLHDDD